MNNLSILFTKYFFIVAFFSILMPKIASAGVKGNFKDYSWLTLTDGNLQVPKPLGTVILKNEKGEVVAEDKDAMEGQLTYVDGFLGFKGITGASFHYRPCGVKVINRRWIEKNLNKPKTFAELTFNKENQWSIKNSDFLFLVSIYGSSFTRTYCLWLAESIVRASVIYLPQGEFYLFGYLVTAKKNGAYVKFRHGLITEHKDCAVIEIPVFGGDTLTRLHFDGMYQNIAKVSDKPNESSFYYLRFFPDGTVTSVLTTGWSEKMRKWFDENYEDRGSYAIHRNRIFFRTGTDRYSTDYEGILEPNRLNLTEYYHTTGNEFKRVYEFVEWKTEKDAKQEQDAEIESLVEQLSGSGDAFVKAHMALLKIGAPAVPALWKAVSGFESKDSQLMDESKASLLVNVALTISMIAKEDPDTLRQSVPACLRFILKTQNSKAKATMLGALAGWGKAAIPHLTGFYESALKSPPQGDEELEMTQRWIVKSLVKIVQMSPEDEQNICDILEEELNAAQGRYKAGLSILIANLAYDSKKIVPILERAVSGETDPEIRESLKQALAAAKSVSK